MTDEYVQGEMTRQYEALSPAERAEVNRSVDESFRKKTGIDRELDAEDPMDRPLVREWLRTRDEVMERRAKSGSLAGKSKTIGVRSLEEPMRGITGIKHTLCIPTLAWLAVQVFFHRTPIEGLIVEFFRSEPDGTLTKLGDSLRTGPDGVARHPATLDAGVYLCRVQHQEDALVSTNSLSNARTALVLPIRSPCFEYDADLGQGRTQSDVGVP